MKSSLKTARQWRAVFRLQSQDFAPVGREILALKLILRIARAAKLQLQALQERGKLTMGIVTQGVHSVSASQFRLNLVEGSVAFSFSSEAARDLQTSLQELMTRLKVVASSGSPTGRPTPQQSLEYRHTGEVFLEIFCNPNIWPTPFAAKVLVTVRDDRIRLTTEAELTRLVEDLNLYLEENS